MRKILIFLLLLPIFLSFISAQPVTKYRRITIFNPLPYYLQRVVTLQLKFKPGEAYNGSIVILDDTSTPIPIQLWDLSLYPNTSYVKSCKISFSVKIPPFTSRTYILSYSNMPLAQYSTLNGIVKFNNNTGEYYIETNDYKLIFGNKSRPGVRIERVGELNWSMYPLVIDWSLVLANGTVIEAKDFPYYEVNVLLNNSLLSILEIVSKSSYAEIRIDVFVENSSLLYFKYYVNVTGDIESIYLPRLLLPVEVKSFTPLGFQTWSVSKLYSQYPPPRIIYFSSGILGVGLTGVNCSLSSILKSINNTLSNSTSWEYYKDILYNLTNLHMVEKFNIMNITMLTQVLSKLRGSQALILKIFENVTKSILEVRDTSVVKRVLGVNHENYYILGYQLNTTQNFFNFSCYFFIPFKKESIYRIMHDMVEVNEILLSHYTITAETQEVVEVDEELPVTIKVESLMDVKNFTVKLEYPEQVFELVSENETVGPLNLTTQIIFNYTWKLVPREIGTYPIRLLVDSASGGLNLTLNVNVTPPPLFKPEKLEAYNLTVGLYKVDGSPLPNRLVRLINLETNQTVGFSVTNSTGLTFFLNVSKGLYVVQAVEREIVKNVTVVLSSNTFLKVVLEISDLTVIVTTPLGNPVPGALVQVFDENGSLEYTGITNITGIVVFKNIPVKHYKISIKYFDRIMATTFLSNFTSEVKLRIEAYRLNLRVVRERDLPLSLAFVEVRSLTTTYSQLWLTNRTSIKGECSFFLPAGKYLIKVYKGQYSVTTEVLLDNDKTLILKCSRGSTLLILTATTILLWISFIVYWYRATSITKREERKYRELLARLEEYYRKGLIEDKFYYKLKSEYEEKLKKLRGG